MYIARFFMNVFTDASGQDFLQNTITKFQKQSHDMKCEIKTNTQNFKNIQATLGPKILGKTGIQKVVKIHRKPQKMQKNRRCENKVHNSLVCQLMKN